MGQKLAAKLKRVFRSDGFKIYFWPIFVLYLFNALLFALFVPLEPSSQKEFIFVHIGCAALLLCLWTLVVRYRKVKGRSVGKRAIVLLVILPAMCLLSLFLTAAFKIVRYFWF
jgi:hypothetical protein